MQVNRPLILTSEMKIYNFSLEAVYGQSEGLQVLVSYISFSWTGYGYIVNGTAILNVMCCMFYIIVRRQDQWSYMI